MDGAEGVRGLEDPVSMSNSMAAHNLWRWMQVGKKGSRQEWTQLVDPE